MVRAAGCPKQELTLLLVNPNIHVVIFLFPPVLACEQSLTPFGEESDS